MEFKITILVQIHAQFFFITCTVHELLKDLLLLQLTIAILCLWLSITLLFQTTVRNWCVCPSPYDSMHVYTDTYSLRKTPARHPERENLTLPGQTLTTLSHPLHAGRCGSGAGSGTYHTTAPREESSVHCGSPWSTSLLVMGLKAVI